VIGTIKVDLKGPDVNARKVRAEFAEESSTTGWTRDRRACSVSTGTEASQSTPEPVPTFEAAAQHKLVSRQEALRSILGSLLSEERTEQPRGAQADEMFGLLRPTFFSADRSHRIVKRGVSSRLLEPLAQYLGLGTGEVAEYLGMVRRAALRKASSDEILPLHAAESMLRLLELHRLAEDTFETSHEADAWMRKPHPMLEGEAPLDCVKSAFGAQRVKDMLLALKHGGVV
jgi:putative toxin-antitoxin system antitoxin component (TIGR02293 family)